MKRIHSWARVGGLAAALVGGTAGGVSACSDEAGSSTTPNASMAGQPNAGEASGGGDAVAGTSSLAAGGAKLQEGDGGRAGELVAGASGEPASGGAPGQVGGDCLVKLSMNSSNAVEPETPLSEKCEVTTFDGQINFTITNGTLLNGRQLNIDFFEKPVMGASVKLEDGYDFQAGKGVAASYVDSVGVWNADKGTVAIESVTGDTFVVKLTAVHFVVIDGPGVEMNTGEFVADGAISGTAMAGM